MDDDLSWLRLTRSRNVGPRSFQRLVGRYGSAKEALKALPEIANRAGERTYQLCSERQGAAEIERAEKLGASMLRLGAPGYPSRLAEIADPPPFLWALGDASLTERSTLAIIGARNASSIGRKLARMLTSDLGAEGHIIVSGLARGIDAAAHSASLETGTVAVLAGGLDTVYPEENADLAGRIGEKGLLLSEAPMGLAPLGRHFPRRNRIVSGLSRAVILIEAAERSGSLITARFALEQGRDAMAAPGAPLDPRAAGCNELIRQGAALIRSAEDVIEALGAPRTLTHPAAQIETHETVEVAAAEPSEPASGLVDRTYALISTTPVHSDILARDLSVPPAMLAQALTELDLAGRIERRPGGLIALAPA